MRYFIQLLTPQCIDAFQDDAKVVVSKPKRRSKIQKTQAEQEAAKQAKQQRALKRLQLSEGDKRSPSKGVSQEGGESPSKKARTE
jgi:hypothetical protein